MLKRLLQFEENLSAFLLALIVVFVFSAAVMRTIGYPIIWSVDFAQLLFIWVCMLGGNQALRRGEHVGVDYFVRRLSLRKQLLLDCVLSFLVMLLMVLLIVYGIKLVLLNPQRDLGTVELPYALVTLAVPVGALLMLITQTWQWVYLMRVAVTGREPDFELPFMQKYEQQDATL